MKLIVAGATGFVATEVICQSLRRPEITSVVALARKPVPVPSNLDGGADASKLASVVVKDYDDYPDHVAQEFAGAAACIWTVAITPSRSKQYAFDEVKRVCQTSTVAGLKAMYEAGPAKPFRFMYMSGYAAERDQTKTPRFLPEYCLMRGQTENLVIDFAERHKGEVEACVAKPGLITGHSIVRSVMATGLQLMASVPKVGVEQVAAAMLDQVTHGFEKEPLQSEDLAALGEESLKRGQGSS